MVHGLRPVGVLVFGYDAAGGPQFHVVVLGTVHEFLPVAVGNFELADVERIDVDLVDRALARFAVAEVVAHFKVAARDEEEVAVAFVDDLGAVGGERGGGSEKQNESHDHLEPPKKPPILRKCLNWSIHGENSGLVVAAPKPWRPF